MKNSFLAASVLCVAFSAPVLAEQVGADQITRCLRPGADVGACSPTRGASVGVAVPAQPTRRVPVAGRPAGLAPATAPATASAEPPAGSPAITLSIPFATGSAALTPAGVSALDELGKALRGQGLADYKFRIEGHTDTVGTREVNLVLSQRRAQRVVDYLRSKYGIGQDRLQPEGMGQDHLLVPTADGVSEPLNRRVQIVNLSVPATATR